MSMVLGMLGAVFLAALAFPISNFTFGNTSTPGGIVLLSSRIFPAGSGRDRLH